MAIYTKTLEEIYSVLAEVGNLLTAIDRQEGDEIAHWQTIGMLDHRLRRLAESLPDEIFYQVPSLAAFALSTDPVYGCWGACYDEVGEILNISK